MRAGEDADVMDDEGLDQAGGLLEDGVPSSEGPGVKGQAGVTAAQVTDGQAPTEVALAQPMLEKGTEPVHEMAARESEAYQA